MPVHALPQDFLYPNPFLPTCRPHSVSFCSQPVLGSLSSNWTAVVPGQRPKASLDRMRSENGGEAAEHPLLEDFILGIIHFGSLSLGHCEDCWSCCLIQVLLMLVMVWSSHFMIQAGWISVYTFPASIIHNMQYSPWRPVWSLEMMLVWVAGRFRSICVTDLSWLWADVFTVKMSGQQLLFLLSLIPRFYWKDIVLSSLNDCAGCKKRGMEPKKRRLVYQQKGG